MAGIRNFFKAAKKHEEVNLLSVSADIDTWVAAGGKIEILDPSARSQPVLVVKKARGAAMAKATARLNRQIAENARRDVELAMESEDD